MRFPLCSAKINLPTSCCVCVHCDRVKSTTPLATRNTKHTMPLERIHATAKGIGYAQVMIVYYYREREQGKNHHHPISFSFLFSFCRLFSFARFWWNEKCERFSLFNGTSCFFHPDRIFSVSPIMSTKWSWYIVVLGHDKGRIKIKKNEEWERQKRSGKR